MLAFEFGYGYALYQLLLCPAQGGQAGCQYIHSRCQCCDTLGKDVKADRFVALCLGQRSAGALGIGQAIGHFLQLLLGTPGARREVLGQLPGQDAGCQACACARGLAVWRVGRSRQCCVDTRDARQQIKLLGIGKRHTIGGALGTGYGVYQGSVACSQRIQADRAGTRLHHRQPLAKSLAPVGKHGVEHGQFVAPLLYVFAEEQQVTVVLQSFLKVMLGQHVRKMRGVWHIGEFAQAPEPAHFVAGVALQHGIHNAARADGGNGLIERIEFAIECRDGALITLGRLAIGAEFGISIGHCNVRFQNRRILHVALRQFHPWHQRQRWLFQTGGRPAHAEQCLVGLWALQAHAFQVIAGGLRLLVGQGREAQGQVGAVAQATVLFVFCALAPQRVQYGGTAVGLPTFDQCNTQVVA